MKIFSARLNSFEEFLTIRSIYFSEPNREAVRKKAMQDTWADHVWFEDEDPPKEVVDLIQGANGEINGNEATED